MTLWYDKRCHDSSGQLFCTKPCKLYWPQWYLPFPCSVLPFSIIYMGNLTVSEMSSSNHNTAGIREMPARRTGRSKGHWSYNQCYFGSQWDNEDNDICRYGNNVSQEKLTQTKQSWRTLLPTRPCPSCLDSQIWKPHLLCILTPSALHVEGAQLSDSNPEQQSINCLLSDCFFQKILSLPRLSKAKAIWPS